MPIYIPMYQRTDYWWDTCPCRIAAWAEDEQRIGELTQRFTQRQKDEQVNAASMRRIVHLTLETFEPQWLHSATPIEHPYAVATAWLTRILQAEQGDYRAVEAPPAALFFYSPGKGRGKTHLAAAITNAALAAGKRAAFTEEHAYLNDCWGKPFEARNEFLTWLGDHVWLSVLDDLGQRAKASAAVADAWYELVNRRWMQARWTIITSNKTPDELLAQGTINDATYSRLAQMTKQQIILFQGTDRRLR